MNHKYVKMKEYGTKHQMGQWRNQRRNLKNTLRQMKMERQHIKSMGYSKSSSKRDVYSDTGLVQKIRKISTIQLYT